MPSVFEVNSIGSVIAFAVWTLVVMALTKALFGSFLAAELLWRLNRSTKQADKLRRQGQLEWELRHGVKYDPDVAGGSPHAAKQPLTAAERERKRLEAAALARGTLLSRAGRYFLSCFACQSFWTALMIYGAVNGRWEIVTLVCTALGYSGSAVVAITILGRSASSNESEAGRRKSVCGGCESIGKAPGFPGS